MEVPTQAEIEEKLDGEDLNQGCPSPASHPHSGRVINSGYNSFRRAAIRSILRLLSLGAGSFYRSLNWDSAF
jgi:hypothetical protein